MLGIDELEHEFNRCAQSASEGLKYWETLKKELSINNNECVLLFPTFDEEVNYISLLYMNQLLSGRFFEKAVILAVDSKVVEFSHLFSDNIRKSIVIDQERATELTQCYSVLEFSNRFFVCSLDKPNGRMGRVLKEKFNYEIEMLICVGIYKIYNYVVEEEVYRDFFLK